MAKNSIADYDSTPANNTDVGGVDIQGTAAASNMDNGLRQLMAHLKVAAFGTSLSLTSTDAGATIGPTIDLYRDGGSQAASDVIGGILFNGEDAAGNKTEYAAIEAIVTDTTNGSEDGTLNFRIMKAGTSATILTLNPNAITQTPDTTNAVWNTNSDANAIILQGGNTANQGGQVFAYGDAHATAASDIAFFSDGSEKYRYDASATLHRFVGSANFANELEVGTLSASGATFGQKFVSTGSSYSLQSSATSTASRTHAQYFNPNGQVGSITTSASATAFNTTSDGRLKANIRDFDAATLIDALDVIRFDWLTGGSSCGVIAQDAYKVFPDAVTPGKGNPGEPGYEPWGVDYSKFVPLLIREVKALRQRMASLESGRGTGLELA